MAHSSPISLEARALLGETDAWNALVARHERRVLLYLVARGLRPCRAREIAQDAWIRLIEQQRAGNLDRLDLPGLVLAQARWLHLDAMRRERVGVSLDEARHVCEPGAEDQPLDRLRLSRAFDALDACGSRDRALFVAAYEEVVSHGDLAIRFGLSLQRTRQILCEVRRRLRIALGEE